MGGNERREGEEEEGMLKEPKKRIWGGDDRGRERENKWLVRRRKRLKGEKRT